MRLQSPLRSPVNFLLSSRRDALGLPFKTARSSSRFVSLTTLPASLHPSLGDTPCSSPATSTAGQENINSQRGHSLFSTDLMATTEMMEMGVGCGVDGGSNNGGLVVTELSHIKELVRQLEVHLGGSPSPDLCKHLASQIFSLTERSIGLITASSLDGAARRKRSAVGDAGLISPLSATPTSDVTDGGGPFKNTKKRKVMEQRRQRVSSAGGENPVDDGHSWRKYGQKEILGAKNPRSYYRCTHRHSQGCQATKQVQRTDEDATLYDVIYHGEHTCTAAGQQATMAPVPADHNPDAHAHLQTLSAGLTVKTEGLLSAVATPLYLSASTPASGGGCQLAPSTTSENWGVSPATSDANNHVALSYVPFEDAEWRGHVELQEVVSALVAASAPTPTPPPAPAVDNFDDFLLDIDITSYFA